MRYLQAILAHKDFTWPERYYEFSYKDYCMTCFTQNPNLHTNLKNVHVFDGLDSKLYGELAIWYYLYNNTPDFDVISLNHYRRRMDAVYPHAENTVTLPQPLTLAVPMFEQFSRLHGCVFANALKDALSDQDKEIFMKSKVFFPYNMFCADKKILGAWLAYTTTIIDKMSKTLGITDRKSCEDFLNSDKCDCLKPVEGRNNTVDYQSRIFGFATERLNSLFWYKFVLNNNGYQVFYNNVELLEQNQHI